MRTRPLSRLAALLTLLQLSAGLLPHAPLRLIRPPCAVKHVVAAEPVDNGSGGGGGGGVQQWLQTNVLQGVALTPSTYSVMVVYFVQGALGLAALARTYFLKDQLGLSPAEQALTRTHPHSDQDSDPSPGPALALRVTVHRCEPGPGPSPSPRPQPPSCVTQPNRHPDTRGGVGRAHGSDHPAVGHQAGLRLPHRRTACQHGQSGLALSHLRGRPPLLAPSGPPALLRADLLGSRGAPSPLGPQRGRSMACALVPALKVADSTASGRAGPSSACVASRTSSSAGSWAQWPGPRSPPSSRRPPRRGGRQPTVVGAAHPCEGVDSQR